MAVNRKGMGQDEEHSHLPKVVKFVFIVILTVILFLLVTTMVHLHFFSGGQLNKHDAIGP